MCNAVKSGKYPFVMCNFAPPDMVGHTGKYEPAIKGCEATGESTVLLTISYNTMMVMPLKFAEMKKQVFFFGHR